MSVPEQSFENHARLDPPYHYFLMPIAGLNVIAAIAILVRTPSVLTAWGLVMSAAFALLVLVTRGYALKVQDRLIRLEERLRMATVLPPDLMARVHELSPGQMVSLRFCSDEELPDLVRSVLDEKLTNRNDIKKRIKTWRADTFRV